MRSCTRTWAFRASISRCASTGGGRGCAEGRRVVSRAPRVVLAASALVGIVFAAALGTFLRSKTDAALPLWDAGTTAFSLVAQFLQTRKWIENWSIWIAVDTVYIGM